MTTFKPPLSLAELTEIQNRNRDNADVRRLLWEIRRMQAIFLQADQVRRNGDASNGIQKDIADRFWQSVEEEPCVKEDAARRQYLLGGWKDDED